MAIAQTATFSVHQIDVKSLKDWRLTRVVLVGILAFAFVSAIFFAANLVRFQLLTDAQSVISIITPLLLYSLFVERAVEVFMSIWRSQESDSLALAVKQGESNPDHDTAEGREQLYSLQHKLSHYKATTRDIAFVTGLVLGILISLAGVRALALFVDPESLADLSPFQTAWFTVLDIFITGALIGGGSDGVHKIVTMIIALFDSTKAKALKNVE